MEELAIELSQAYCNWMVDNGHWMSADSMQLLIMCRGAWDIMAVYVMDNDTDAESFIAEYLGKEENPTEITPNTIANGIV